MILTSLLRWKDKQEETDAFFVKVSKCDLSAAEVVLALESSCDVISCLFSSRPSWQPSWMWWRGRPSAISAEFSDSSVGASWRRTMLWKRKWIVWRGSWGQRSRKHHQLRRRCTRSIHQVCHIFTRWLFRLLVLMSFPLSDRPAPDPAALAMAIINSTKCVSGRASSDAQVPLVIISQPVPGPVPGLSAATPPTLSDLQNEVVLETDMTSLPVGVNQVADPEDTPKPVAVSLSTDLMSSLNFDLEGDDIGFWRGLFSFMCIQGGVADDGTWRQAAGPRRPPRWDEWLLSKDVQLLQVTNIRRTVSWGALSFPLHH